MKYFWNGPRNSVQEKVASGKKKTDKSENMIQIETNLENPSLRGLSI